MLEGLAAQIELEKDIYAHFSQGHLITDRRITPQDIANAVRWLASEESRFLKLWLSEDNLANDLILLWIGLINLINLD